MQIVKAQELLKVWFKAVIKGQDIPYDIISTDFYMEDGMELQDYWGYEVNNFRLNAKKFFISSNVNVIIHSYIPLDSSRNLVLVYILNRFGGFAFKMTMTVSIKEGEYFISSNNYNTQIVAKYVIENNCIIQRGIAVKVHPHFEIKKVLSLDMEEISFDSSPDFDGESFASGRYSLSGKILDVNTCDFRIYLQNLKDKNLIIEKRKIIFDAPDLYHKPFILKGQNLSIVDEKLPVNVVLMNVGEMKSFSYPRELPDIDMSQYERIIMTDAQDNDWIVK